MDNQYLQVVLDDEGNDEQELVEVIRAPEQDLAGTPFKRVHLRTPLKKWLHNSLCSLRTPSIVKGNKSLNLVWSKWGSQWWGFWKVFNVLQSPIGRMASCPMRNIETFPSKHMYLYLSLVERKVAEFCHNMEWMLYLTYFNWKEFMVSLPGSF